MSLPPAPRRGAAPQERGELYRHLTDEEYAAVQLLVACEGAMEPEGFPDEWVDGMALCMADTVTSLVVHATMLLHRRGVELPVDSLRRIVIAALRDDGQNALDYLESRL